MVSKVFFLQGVNNLPAHGVVVELSSVLVSELREAGGVDVLEKRDLWTTETLEIPDVFGLAWMIVAVPKLHGVVSGAILPNLSAGFARVTSFGDINTLGLNLDLGLELGLGLGLELGSSLSLRPLAQNSLASAVADADRAAQGTINTPDGARGGRGFFVYLDDSFKLGLESLVGFERHDELIFKDELCGCVEGGLQREEKRGGGERKTSKFGLEANVQTDGASGPPPVSQDNGI